MPTAIRAAASFVKRQERRVVSAFDGWLTQERPRRSQLLFCVGVCATVLAIRLLLEHWLRGSLPFLFFGPMVAVCALGAGWSGGVLAIASTLAYSAWLSPHHGDDVVAGNLNILSNVFITFVCDRCRAALREVKRQRTELQTRSRIQVELALKSASLGGLTASMRHEVNQPLTAVKTYAQAGMRWLSRDPPDVGECRATLLRIVEGADQADGILKRLGGSVSGRPLTPVVLPLGELVAEATALIRPEADANGVLIAFTPVRGNLGVLGDRVLLQQVFSNLLGNAVQACASRAQGERLVEIACEADGDVAVVSIADTGPGFREVDLEQSFDAFYTTKPGGMGLGLPISRMTVEAHHGTLNVGNRRDRVGGLASVRLPLAA